MKKTISLLLSFVMLLSLAPVTQYTANAASEWSYEQLDDGTFWVTQYHGTAKEVTIPSKIDSKTITGVGRGVFSECENISSIKVSSGINEIAPYAFWDGCNTLKSVDLPKSITTFGYSVFYDTDTLTNIIFAGTKAEWDALLNYYGYYDLPQSASIYCSDGEYYDIGTGSCGKNVKYSFNYSTGVLNITGSGEMKNYGDYRFGEHSPFFCNPRIKKVIIGNGVTTIGDYSFMWSDRITGISIPNTVKKIGAHSFEDNNGYTSITIPDSVEVIGASAFRYCKNLETIKLSSNLKVIGDGAFTHCISLESINLPDSLEVLDSRSFSECSSLTELHLPKNVSKIGYYHHEYDAQDEDVTYFDEEAPFEGMLFTGSDNVAKITVDSENKYFDSRNNCNAIIETSTNTLLITCKKTVVPDGVKNIGQNAFRDLPGIENIVLPSGVINIEKYSFALCQDLKSIKIPKSVKRIDCGAFFYTNLTDVYYYGTQSEWNAINIDSDNEALAKATIHYNCGQCTHSYKTTVIAPTCTEKGYTRHTCTKCGSYYDDTYVNAKGHKKTAAVKENEVVATCSATGSYDEVVYCSVCKAEVSRTRKTVAKTAHKPAAAVKEKIVAATCVATGTYDSVIYCSVCKTEISRTKKTSDALGHLWNSGVVTTPATETSTGIRTYTCTRCEQTKTEIIPEVEHVHIYNQVVTSPTCTKQGYTTYTCRCGDSYVSNYVSATGHKFVNNICINCNIKEYTYELDDSNFATITRYKGDASVLTLPSVIDGYTVRKIAIFAFYDSKSLVSVTIPEGYKSIDSIAFAECSNLKTINLPSTINMIGDRVFANTAYSGTQKNWDNGVLYIGQCAVQSDSGISGHVDIKDGTKLICINCFRNGSKITSVDVPSSVSYINRYAFSGCSSLTNVRIYNKQCVISDYEDEFLNQTVIEGPHNSTAQAYAEKYGRTFEPIHSWLTENAEVVSPTCTEVGYTVAYCKYCDATKEINFVNKLPHEYVVNELAPGSIGYYGYINRTCDVCGYEDEYIIEPIESVSLEKTSFTYNGKVQKPSVSVMAADGTELSEDDYDVSYAKGLKNVGSYAVTVNFKNNYVGTKKLTYKINPKSTTLSKITRPRSRQIKVTWKKQATQTTGYEIQYSTSSKFTKKTTKKITVKKNKTTKTTIKKLKSRKKYYVRIRTYKKVGKTKYYSSWSKAKSIKVK